MIVVDRNFSVDMVKKLLVPGSGMRWRTTGTIPCARFPRSLPRSNSDMGRESPVRVHPCFPAQVCLLFDKNNNRHRPARSAFARIPYRSAVAGSEHRSIAAILIRTLIIFDSSQCQAIVNCLNRFRDVAIWSVSSIRRRNFPPACLAIKKKRTARYEDCRCAYNQSGWVQNEF